MTNFAHFVPKITNPLEFDGRIRSFFLLQTGNYYVDVTLDGAPMRDSPFLLRIGGRDDSDPTAITVSGEGIHNGQTGQKCEFIINTCNAGAGQLFVQMDGPSKATLDAYEVITVLQKRSVSFN